jgi:hypothetical protein
MNNAAIASELAGFAERLEREQGNLYRIQAYRRAAETVRRLDQPVKDIVARDGVAGLRRLPGIGAHLAAAIERLCSSGAYHTLADGAEAVSEAERLESLPGVGPRLAELLWKQLNVQTVGELAALVHSPEFEDVPLSDRRRHRLVQAVADWQQRSQGAVPAAEPEVGELLSVDEEFRRQAGGGHVFHVAGSGEEGAGLLPLLSVRRNGWKLLAMYCSSALAHRLGRNRDWVVVYFQRDQHRGQRTVVTERRGDLRGRRVVRGRESECRLSVAENRGQWEKAAFDRAPSSQAV